MPEYPDRTILPGYNDEPLHLHYVKHMASGGDWPIWSPDSLNHLTDAYIHPPVYYSFTAPAFKLGEWIKTGWGLYAARLVSVIFGIVAGLFIYRIALLWFDDRSIAAGALAAGLLAPNAIMFTSIVTNDSLLYCFSALAIHSLVQCRLGKSGVWRDVLTGGYIAAAVWVKMSGLTLIPLAWFAASPAARAGDRWLRRVRVFLIAIMLIMPLLLRNVAFYGSFVPGQRTPLSEEYWPEKAVGAYGGAVSHPISAVKTCLRLAAVPLMDVWGSIFEKGFSMLWVLVGGGVFLAGVHLLIGRPPRDYIFVMAVALVVMGFIWHNIRLYQVEFRLMMPAFPAMAMLAAKGAAELKIPVWVQVIFWCLPILLMPFF